MTIERDTEKNLHLEIISATLGALSACILAIFLSHTKFDQFLLVGIEALSSLGAIITGTAFLKQNQRQRGKGTLLAMLGVLAGLIGVCLPAFFVLILVFFMASGV